MRHLTRPRAAKSSASIASLLLPIADPIDIRNLILQLFQNTHTNYPELLICDSGWVGGLDRYCCSFGHANTDQSSKRFQESKSLLVRFIGGADNKYCVCTSTTCSPFLDRLFELRIIVLGEVIEDLRTAFHDKILLRAVVNSDDSQSQDPTCILHSQMAQATTSTADDNPVTRLGVSFPKARVDRQSRAKKGCSLCRVDTVWNWSCILGRSDNKLLECSGGVVAGYFLLLAGIVISFKARRCRGEEDQRISPGVWILSLTTTSTDLSKPFDTNSGANLRFLYS